MIATNRPLPDAEETQRALGILFDDDDVIELRALFHRGRKRTCAGYFDALHRDELIRHAARLNNEGAAVYVTMNALDPQLLGRYANRIEDFAQATATDANILHRRRLLLDFDPARPKDTSATDEQLEAAKGLARRCMRELRASGWPDPVAVMSGNGVHLLYRLDLPNDDASRELVKAVLEALALLFDTDTVKLDRSVFNAGRIVKLPGTVANKGDNVPTAPWRVSRILHVPQTFGIVSAEQLREVAPVKSETTVRGAEFSGGRTFDLEGFLGRLGIEYEQDRHDGRERYKLHHCPFNADHGKGEAAIFRAADGALGFRCQHNSCVGKTWHDVRALVDGPREHRTKETTAQQSVTVSLICGTDLIPEPIRWLWREWLARGKLHIIAGAPGTGKTTIAIAVAATVTASGRWPDGTRAEAGNVLIWSGEDDPHDTLLPRLIAMGADLNRVYFVGDVLADGKPRPFDPARDMVALEREAARIGNVSLLIVDPIVNMVSGDSHKNTETRRALQPVVDLAARLDAVALGISHFSKATAGRDPVERVTGSVAFGALPRIVFGAAKSTDDSGRRLFVRAKSNIGPDGGGFGYELQQADLPGFPGLVASRVLWGGPLDGTARDLLAVAETPADQGERSATDDATDWLRELLAAGPMEAADVKRGAGQAGIGEKPLRLARQRLRIKPRKSAFAGGWVWALPSVEDAQGAQDAVSQNGGIFGGKGHLRQPATSDGEAL